MLQFSATHRSPVAPLAFYMRQPAFREGLHRRARGVCVLRAVVVALVCLQLSACGFSIPIKPLASDLSSSPAKGQASRVAAGPASSLANTDDIVTGSIRPAPQQAQLEAGLNAEDWRRASNAMSVALDPLGNGERAGWDNPETGHSGAFRSAGLPFVRAGEVCRAWTAEVRTKAPARHQEGTSCRAPGEDWRVAANQKLAEAE